MTAPMKSMIEPTKPKINHIMVVDACGDGGDGGGCGGGDGGGDGKDISSSFCDKMHAESKVLPCGEV